MLRVLLVLLTAFFLVSGPTVDKKPTSKQEPNPLAEISSCEEGWPPKACPPHCDC